MYHYFVYYRIDPRQAAEAAAAVEQLLFEMEAETGVQGRLLRSCTEPALWMEIYENVPHPSWEMQLAACVDRLELCRYLQAGVRRRVECFQG